MARWRARQQICEATSTLRLEAAVEAISFVRREARGAPQRRPSRTAREVSPPPPRPRGTVAPPATAHDTRRDAGRRGARAQRGRQAAHPARAPGRALGCAAGLRRGLRHRRGGGAPSQLALRDVRGRVRRRRAPRRRGGRLPDAPREPRGTARERARESGRVRVARAGVPGVRPPSVRGVARAMGRRAREARGRRRPPRGPVALRARRAPRSRRWRAARPR